MLWLACWANSRAAQSYCSHRPSRAHEGSWTLHLRASSSRRKMSQAISRSSKQKDLSQLGYWARMFGMRAWRGPTRAAAHAVTVFLSVASKTLSLLAFRCSSGLCFEFARPLRAAPEAACLFGVWGHVLTAQAPAGLYWFPQVWREWQQAGTLTGSHAGVLPNLVSPWTTAVRRQELGLLGGGGYQGADGAKTRNITWAQQERRRSPTSSLHIGRTKVANLIPTWNSKWRQKKVKHDAKNSKQRWCILGSFLMRRKRWFIDKRLLVDMPTCSLGTPAIGMGFSSTTKRNNLGGLFLL